MAASAAPNPRSAGLHDVDLHHRDEMPLRGRTDVHSANDLDTWKLRRSTNQVLVTRDGQSSDHGTSMVAFERWRASRGSLADTLPAVLPDPLPSKSRSDRSHHHGGPGSHFAPFIRQLTIIDVGSGRTREAAAHCATGGTVFRITAYGATSGTILLLSITATSPVGHRGHEKQAPFYFQNFLGVMAPQPLPNGGRGWAVPMDPALRVIHAGDVTEVGRTVAAAFAAGDELPDGSVLAVCGGRYSWNDFAKTLNALGHHLMAVQVPADVYDVSYPGAHEVRETFQYFAEHTYFGPQHEAHIRAAHALVPGGFTSFADWARVHMKP